MKELQRFIMFNSKPKHDPDSETQDGTVVEDRKSSKILVLIDNKIYFSNNKLN